MTPWSNGPELGLSVTPSDLYLDAAATTPPLQSVIDCINAVQRDAWGNPSSLHGTGLVAAERLARSRQAIAGLFNAQDDELIFTSGATESVHLALLGVAAGRPPGRLVISAVEHPALEGAAAQLEQSGWMVDRWPVDATGLIRLELMDQLLAPPTTLVSLIWGQSEVGTVQPSHWLPVPVVNGRFSFTRTRPSSSPRGWWNGPQQASTCSHFRPTNFRVPGGLGCCCIARGSWRNRCCPVADRRVAIALELNPLH